SFLAHSQYKFLSLIQITSITGTYFISYLIVAFNCIIYHVLMVYSTNGGQGVKACPAKPQVLARGVQGFE
ncbi:MAG: hypothetical protein NTU69_05695, partial [Proteobacteria bacterium]|nr:hypothetical protein [Pseudomonadota bacterium]